MKTPVRNPRKLSAWPPSLSLLRVGSWLLPGLGAASTAILLRAAGLAAPVAAILGLMAWGGWALTQARFQRQRLARAERLWSLDRPSGAILAEVSRAGPARGETGYRLHLLASRVRLGEGDRAGAWQESLQAHLCRLPLWKRIPLLCYSPLSHHLDPQTATGWDGRLHRFAPEMPPLGHRLALRELATGDPVDEKTSWERLLAMLPAIQDDPILLESMMTCALARIQNPLQLGHQEWSPLVPYLFDAALNLLLCRHGEPRVAWDRTPPALHLLQQGRPRDVLRLTQSLPLARRSASLCEAEIAALRQTGDLRGAQTAIRAALEVHPGAFRLWMERFHAAMAAAKTDIALDSLEMARRLLPAQPETLRGILQSEWHLRRAEFAHWIERAPALAWEHLLGLPEHARIENGLLVLQVRVALGDYEAALEDSRRLLARQPQDLDLLMLQAECLAGMDAWALLLPFMEELAEKARQRPAFWHLRGLAQAHLGHPQEAREDLETAVHMVPRDLQMVLDAGHASMELGDHTRAEHHWRRALLLDPKCEEALIQWADTRHAKQDRDGARRLLRECLLHHPDSEGAQVFLAELEAN